MAEGEETEVPEESQARPRSAPRDTAADAATDAGAEDAGLHAALAARGPYGTTVGSALITMVEPHPGHEHAYNRWYEDDHFIAGAMAMPHMFAGRRWVATRELQLLRYPEKSAIAQPITAGCYLSTYWLTPGRYPDHIRWSVEINKRLNRDGRVYQDRTHVFTAFQEHVATAYRDGAAGPRDFHALDHPYQGLVVEVIDTDTAEQSAAAYDWLMSRGLPRRLPRGGPAAMCVLFRPMPLPAGRMSYVKEVEGLDTRLTLLWFLDLPPQDCWSAAFTGLDEETAGAVPGARVELVAPFLPTVPGTDRYVDQLR
ncbi:hypothetical protein [Phaeacidiphilus oryzae]|uniref:hypothetical protein n=1 Tax=Phaeacidiphilus oryzae TaxID=348818 RepID=UPI000A566469|nr:hypothetical protein [Phaeacidiphilus oryzae]